VTRPQPRRTHDRPDEGLAIMFVLLSVLISMGLAIGLMGVLLSELTPTVYQRKSARTIAASQAGLQVGLAAIRAATTPGVGPVGDMTRLPCPGTPFIGALAGTSGTLGYTVQIRYYTVDPTDQPALWRLNNQIKCGSTGSLPRTPLYALVQSRATGDSSGAMLGATWGDRSSELVYALNRTDQAFVGGLIRTGLASTSADLCWQSTTSPPTAGDSIELATCVTGKDAQTFSYRTDYSIVLSSTQAPTSPPTGGICVDGDMATSNKKKRRAPTTTTWVLTFQPCDGSWQQKWSYNDNGQLESVKPDLSSLSGLCVGSGGVYGAGTDLYVETCSAEWAPERTLGAGAAGATTSQLINYAEYGRCLDVTNQTVSYPWLIAYPCKQDPTRSITWNQRFVWDSAVTRQIQTNPGSPYCLTTPGAGSDRVLTTACVAGRSDQQWTMLGDTGNRTTSYTVVDSVGRCLSLAPSPQVGGTLSQWSMIAAEPCDGSFEQKWNAPPLPTGGSLSGERETTRDPPAP